MRHRIKKLLSRIGTLATKVESWLALVAMFASWGFFAWLGNQWSDLAAHGWAAVAFFALGVTCIVAAVVSFSLIAWRYFHPLQRHFLPFDASAYLHDPAAGAPDREAYFSLLDFAVQVLWPACDRQIDLQTALIRESKADDLIKELAIEGMPIDSRPSAQPFWIQYQNLLQGIEGSEPTIGFDALVNCINQMANGAYKNFCDQSKELASAAGISDVRSHRTLGWIWQQWAEQHDGLIIEHKKLRQNPRLGRKVYRPNKPANWGDRALTGDDKWGGRRSE